MTPAPEMASVSVPVARLLTSALCCIDPECGRAGGAAAAPAAPGGRHAGRAAERLPGPCVAGAAQRVPALAERIVAVPEVHERAARRAPAPRLHQPPHGGAVQLDPWLEAVDPAMFGSS